MLKTIWDKALNRDVRFITFAGNPVNEPLYKTFWRSAHCKTAALVSAPLVISALAEENYAQALTHIFTAAIAYLQNECFLNQGIYSRFYAGSNACIDKNGKLALVTGKALHHQFFSNSATRIHLSAAIINMAFRAPYFSNQVENYLTAISSSAGNRNCYFLTWGACTIAMELAAAFRFFRVSQQKWVIVKTPNEKTKKRDEETVGKPTAVPVVI